jgi:transcriptional regulator with XRE-family HTH domain
MKQDIYNTIGKNIQKYRKNKGMRQHDLAQSLFLSDSFIAKLESKTRQTISIDTLEQIAEVLGVDITVFFDKSVFDNK